MYAYACIVCTYVRTSIPLIIGKTAVPSYRVHLHTQVNQYKFQWLIIRQSTLFAEPHCHHSVVAMKNYSALAFLHFHIALAVVCLHVCIM